jgi:hypothetical protein
MKSPYFSFDALSLFIVATYNSTNGLNNSSPQNFLNSSASPKFVLTTPHFTSQELYIFP